MEGSCKYRLSRVWMILMARILIVQFTCIIPVSYTHLVIFQTLLQPPDPELNLGLVCPSNKFGINSMQAVARL